MISVFQLQEGLFFHVRSTTYALQSPHEEGLVHRVPLATWMHCSLRCLLVASLPHQSSSLINAEHSPLILAPQHYYRATELRLLTRDCS